MSDISQGCQSNSLGSDGGSEVLGLFAFLHAGHWDQGVVGLHQVVLVSECVRVREREGERECGCVRERERERERE